MSASATRTLGSVAGQRRFADATLVEVRYGANAVLPTHTHPGALFLLTVGGTFEELVEGRPRAASGGALLYRPAGERHSQRFGRYGATCLAIELSDPGAQAVSGGLMLTPAHALRARRMYDEFRRPSAETPLVVEETVATLLGEGLRSVTSGVESSPPWLRRVVDAIESQLSGTLRLCDLAREAGRHPVHVSRCFRRSFGVDVAEFVRRRRLHEACRLVRETRASLSDIAASAGFSDQSHMGRTFRAVMGRSPGAYRSAPDTLPQRRSTRRS